MKTKRSQLLIIVLIVLTVSGKLFGIWGLVLGLPVSRYFFGEAIRYKEGKNGEANQSIAD